jgi:hypothetical protein
MLLGIRENTQSHYGVQSLQQLLGVCRHKVSKSAHWWQGCRGTVCGLLVKIFVMYVAR